jgi:hypothetical protein
MKLIERSQIFKQQKNISSLIKGFQESIFDEEFDKVDDEMFDAMSLKIEKDGIKDIVIKIKNFTEMSSYLEKPNQL